jgi:hypothetical protein
VTSTTPVTAPSGPVSKLPLVFSSDPSVVIGQPGFAKQFQDFQELARPLNPSLVTGPAGLIAGASPGPSSDSSAVVVSAGGDQSQDGLITSASVPSHPESSWSKNWTGLSGVVQGDHLMMSGPVDGSGGPLKYVALVGQAVPPALPVPNGSDSVQQPALLAPLPDGSVSAQQPAFAAPLPDGSPSAQQPALLAPLPNGSASAKQPAFAAPLPDGSAPAQQPAFAAPLPDGSASAQQPT